MLVQFRVENHRSLRDEQVLSLVASTAKDRAEPIAVEGLGESLLPVMALYGANASGKTNVLHALGFMRDAVLLSHRLWEPQGGAPREPFALSERAPGSSLYEVDVIVGGIRHRYGFVLSDEGIAEEWLHAWPRGRKQVWFEREESRFEFGKHLTGENETIRKVTRTNSLFLSAAVQNSHAQLTPIFQWFQAAQLEVRRSSTGLLDPRNTSELAQLFADSGPRSLGGEDDALRSRREGIVRLLRAADIGIRDLKIERRGPGAYRHSGPGGDRARHELFFLHESAGDRSTWLPMEAESAGTLTLLGLANRILDVLQRGALLCVDELEASLHPTLSLEILRLFQERGHNPRGAQLLFTTHDVNLLGNILGEPPLRRDQIWFTEKDGTGATRLYPLTDFQPRKEENLERGYLQGRYGGLPVLGDLVPDSSTGEEGEG
jgi:hypothetical protein